MEVTKWFPDLSEFGAFETWGDGWDAKGDRIGTIERSFEVGQTKIATEFAFATVIPEQDAIPPLLVKNNWRLVGRRVNPNTHNAVYLWFKHFGAGLRQKVAPQEDRRTWSMYCCGAKLYQPPLTIGRPRQIAIYRRPPGIEAPGKGWRLIGATDLAEYYTFGRVPRPYWEVAA